MTKAVRRHEQPVASAELTLRTAVRAELPNGQEGVLDGGGAAHVAQDHGARDAMLVGGKQVKIADSGALPGLFIDTHDVLVRGSSVDQV
eukprot:2019489-Pleurochrysis_carterae.AAC.1